MITWNTTIWHKPDSTHPLPLKDTRVLIAVDHGDGDLMTYIGVRMKMYYDPSKAEWEWNYAGRSCEGVEDDDSRVVLWSELPKAEL